MGRGLGVGIDLGSTVAVATAVAVGVAVAGAVAVAVGVDVGVGLKQIEHVGVGVGVGVTVGVGVGVGPDCAQYLPPVFRKLLLSPPHMIISLPVQTAVCRSRLSGASFVVVVVQLSVLGLYLPPVFK